MAKPAHPTNVYSFDLFPGFYFLFCPSEKKADDLSKWYKVKLNYPAHRGGRCETIQGNGNRICVVYVPAAEGSRLASRAAMLAHECVHALDELWDYIGEDNPSSELRAYAMQYMMEMMLPELMIALESKK